MPVNGKYITTPFPEFRSYNSINMIFNMYNIKKLILKLSIVISAAAAQLFVSRRTQETLLQPKPKG